MSFRFRIAVVLLIACLAAPAWADFQAGMDAANRGDYATALREWQPLAEQEDIQAQALLGLLYANGEGVPQDYKKAAQWYEKAAAQGNAMAQLNLGSRYFKGEGVPQDYKKAAQWYEKAVAQGNAGAQFNLGVMYFLGQGVPQDYAKARKLYEKAAAQGNADAQYNLGVVYFKGQGVPQDYVQAHMWFNLAAANGDKTVVDLRNALANQMTPTQIAEAQKLAREWKPIKSNGLTSAEWVLVEENNELAGIMTVYVDLNSVRRNGDLVKMWELLDYKEIPFPTEPYLSTKIQKQFDCAKKRLRVLRYGHFSGNMGNGKPLRHETVDDREWSPLEAVSNNLPVWRLACNKK